MELVTRQSERSGDQQRLLQAFTEDVFIFSLLMYIAHWSFQDDALSKFTYLLTSISHMLILYHICVCVCVCMFACARVCDRLRK